VAPGKSGTEILADLSNKGRKGATFFSLVLHQNSHILGRKWQLSNDLLNFSLTILYREF
jgi:hypothetical protein